MYLKQMNIKEIIPYDNNPRKNDGAVEAVMESIKQCGYIAPIIIDENNIVLAGHTRLKALKKMGRKEVEVGIVEGLTEEQKKKYRILDNKTNEFAEWDFNALAAELEALDFDGFDFGFDDDVLDEFSDEFALPDGEQGEMRTMSFQVHERQKELIEYALETVKDDISETFGNENKNGNALYEVVRQWAALRK